MTGPKAGLNKATVNKRILRKSFGTMHKTKEELTLIVIAPPTATIPGRNNLRNKLGQSLMSSLTLNKTSPTSNVMTPGELTSNKKFKLVLLMPSQVPSSH